MQDAAISKSVSIKCCVLYICLVLHLLVMLAKGKLLLKLERDKSSSVPLEKARR